MTISKVEQFILDKYKENYPNAIPVLEGLLAGETVANLSIKYGTKEQSIRNLKFKYKELFK